PSQDKTGTLTASSLRGLGMPQGVDYGGLEVLNIWLGFGNNQFTINGTHAGATTVYAARGNDTFFINDASGSFVGFGEDDADVFNVRGIGSSSTVTLLGQQGADVFNVSDASPTLAAPSPADATPPPADRIGSIDRIDGLLIVIGGDQFDVLNVDDSIATADKIGVLTAATIRGLELPLGIDYAGMEDLNLWLGSGADDLFVHSTHAAPTQIFGGDGPDAVGAVDDIININTIAFVTTIHGQGGNDIINVNVFENPAFAGDGVDNDGDGLVDEFNEAGQSPLRTGLNGLPAVLNIHGQGDSDLVVVNVSGFDGALVNVFDNGAPDDGADTLVINGVDAVLAGPPGTQAFLAADLFLLRLDFVAHINDVDGDGAITAADKVERVNYDQNINARLIVNGLRGDDTFVADDNSSITTLDGGGGDDTFQIGQVFGRPRTVDAGIAPGDTFETTAVIIGVIRDPASGDILFNPAEDDLDAAARARIQQAVDDAAGAVLDGIAYLSQGVSHPTTVFGGNGRDLFSVYRNRGPLRLEGEDGNDSFIVRAFVVIELGQEQADTEVNGGSGEDLIQYAINAPVSIDGGDGFDTVVVLGTPFPDNFVVTERGIFGAGLNVTFDNVESAEVDGLEGDDDLFVLSTSPNLVTRVIGGLGSDRIHILADVTERIISDDLLGRSGFIAHAAFSADPDFGDVAVDGIGVTVVGSGGGTLVDISPTGEYRRVTEAGVMDSYFIQLTGPLASDGDGFDNDGDGDIDEADEAFQTVYLTVSAGVASTADRSTGSDDVDNDGDGAVDELDEAGDSILVATDPGGPFSKAVVLTFT
ncbi:MAG TPA: hypothetical protein VIH00_11100, partial [Candidatus Limnocylindrales bacterium]